ncbi:hypothetical protein [Candidatus Leptofilum sp.]|uniref:hypothetical protein n=1 Tax=Candidatus Leptofilum sp. TaxID=3241576 RepID=UPI003B5AD9B9
MNKNPWVAAVLNFFFLGLGTLYNGRRKLTGIGLTVTAVVFIYVENQLRTVAPTLFPIMFGAVFVAATVLAIDAYNEAKAMS